jgi:hypothetical protein
VSDTPEAQGTPDWWSNIETFRAAATSSLGRGSVISRRGAHTFFGAQGREETQSFGAEAKYSGTKQAFYATPSLFVGQEGLGDAVRYLGIHAHLYERAQLHEVEVLRERGKA